MKNREIEVSARDGSGIVVKASLAFCECGCEQWFVYAVMGRTGTHLHLQCADCGVTECGGDCTQDEARIAHAE